jgi:hypothetical protein
MRRARHVPRKRESSYVRRLLVWTPQGKRPLGRPRGKWVDIVRIGLWEVEWGEWECGFGPWWVWTPSRREFPPPFMEYAAHQNSIIYLHLNWMHFTNGVSFNTDMHPCYTLEYRENISIVAAWRWSAARTETCSSDNKCDQLIINWIYVWTFVVSATKISKCSHLTVGRKQYSLVMIRFLHKWSEKYAKWVCAEKYWERLEILNGIIECPVINPNPAPPRHKPRAMLHQPAWWKRFASSLGHFT